ncbi:MAG TPA: MFS transporter [Anaerolineales bacterium]|nr:MFS transporter [Anaerolineales bacterium]
MTSCSGNIAAHLTQVNQRNYMQKITLQDFPFYYGWFLLPFATLGVIMSIPGQTAGFSAFTEPLLNISGISRTALSTAYLIGTISSGFILPTIGKYIDRIGSRKMMVFASVSLGITLLFMSQVDKAVHYLFSVLSFIPIEILFIGIFIVGIFCLRFFGQGLLPIISNTMIGKWFEQNRGKAVAAMGVANSLAFASAPAVMSALVLANGWRNAWLILSGVLGIGMSSIAILIYRDDPESSGLYVDGIKPEQDQQERVNKELVGVDLTQARKTLIFWLLGFGLAIFAAINTGFTFHIAAIGEQAGISLDRALAIFIPISFITIPVSFIGSWVSDKTPNYLYILFLALGEVIAFGTVYFLNTFAGYLGAIIGLGISGGLMGPIISNIFPKLFGRKYLGAINGAVASMIVIGSALGPVYLSVVNDMNGSFALGILYSVIPSAAILFSSFKVRSE